MIYIFDLDLTLWDTYNKHNEPIWAKQLLWPMKHEGDIVTDDVGSTCVLRKGVREYIKFLYDEGHDIGFVSAGRHWDFADKIQPSVFLLKHFHLYEYFGNIRILEYKTMNKSEAIKHITDKIVFYDDSPKVLKELEVLNNVIAVDSSNIKDWSTMIGKDYD